MMTPSKSRISTLRLALLCPMASDLTDCRVHSAGAISQKEDVSAQGDEPVPLFDRLSGPLRCVPRLNEVDTRHQPSRQRGVANLSLRFDYLRMPCLSRNSERH